MTASHFSGPLVVYGNPAQGPNENPEIGPSLFWGGTAFLDQRAAIGYNPGQPSPTPIYGWLGGGVASPMSPYVPATLSTTNLANGVTPTTAVPARADRGRRLYQPALPVINRATGLAVTGLFLIDGLDRVGTTSTIAGNLLTIVTLSSGQFTVGSVLSGGSGSNTVATNTTILQQLTGATGGAGTYLVDTPQTITSATITGGSPGTNGVPRVPFGPDGTVSLYNPFCMLGRNVRITTAAGDTAVYTVAGYDIYGYPQTEAITAAGATTVSGKKAFKYIASVTPGRHLSARPLRWARATSTASRCSAKPSRTSRSTGTPASSPRARATWPPLRRALPPRPRVTCAAPTRYSRPPTGPSVSSSSSTRRPWPSAPQRGCSASRQPSPRGSIDMRGKHHKKATGGAMSGDAAEGDKDYEKDLESKPESSRQRAEDRRALPRRRSTAAGPSVAMAARPSITRRWKS